jgi:hypothetical protein
MKPITMNPKQAMRWRRSQPVMREITDIPPS